MARLNLRSGATLLALVVVIAACGSTGTDPTIGAPRVAVEPLVDGLPRNTVMIEALDDISGQAPAIPTGLRSIEAEYVDWDGFEFVYPPQEAEFSLIGCSFLGPGLYGYEFEVSGAPEYPFQTTLVATRSEDDVDTRVVVAATITRPGPHTFIESTHDHAAANWDNWLDRRTAGAAGVVDSTVAVYGSACSLQFGSGEVLESGSIARSTVELEQTAPEGTVERLAQAAFGKPGAPLAPLANVYGEAVAFFTDTWFIPEEPSKLVEVREEQRRNGCLAMNAVYTEYTISQENGCAAVAAPAVSQSGQTWIAHASDGAWVIRVFADSRDTAEAVAGSLRPYRLLANQSGRRDSAADPPADSTKPIPGSEAINAYQCDAVPRELDNSSIGQARSMVCATGSRGVATLALFFPNREVVRPPGGGQPVDYLCTGAFVEDGSSFDCSMDVEELYFPLGAGAVLVKPDIDEVIATFLNGQTITSTPVDGLAFIDVSDDTGRLLEIVVRRGDRFEVVYPNDR